MKKISIIIPCFNAASYIEQCISRLASQTYKDFEIVFVDDCSTDETLNLLYSVQSKYKDLDIKILHNDVNLGPGISRNKGIKQAYSKYITFCDCDDWYDYNFLEKMLSLLEKNNADIAFCGYKIVDENGNSQIRQICKEIGILTRKQVYSLDVDSLCMLLVKTDLMKKTLLPNLRNGEDIATVPLLIAKSSKYVATKECLYNYFRRQGSASETPSMKVVNSLLASFKYTKENFPSQNREELEYLGIKNLLYASIITLFSFSFDKDKARSILLEFEKEFPNWYSNPYKRELKLYKKIVITFLYFRLFCLIKLVAIARNNILK